VTEVEETDYFENDIFLFVSMNAAHLLRCARNDETFSSALGKTLKQVSNDNLLFA
jgi:hypothetical protein